MWCSQEIWKDVACRCVSCPRHIRLLPTVQSHWQFLGYWNRGEWLGLPNHFLRLPLLFYYFYFVFYPRHTSYQHEFRRVVGNNREQIMGPTLNVDFGMITQDNVEQVSCGCCGCCCSCGGCRLCMAGLTPTNCLMG